MVTVRTAVEPTADQLGEWSAQHSTLVAAASLAGVLAIGTGCKQDARLADATIKPAVVTDVTDAGLSLDKNATPEMVTFALLEAIKDDVEADGDAKAREAAFDRQFRLAAPSAIHQRHIHWVGAQHADLDESVYKTVRTWAPTLAYYLAGFGLFCLGFLGVLAFLSMAIPPLARGGRAARDGRTAVALIAAPQSAAATSRSAGRTSAENRSSCAISSPFMR